jgi:membrane protein required for colicin V production
VNWLDYLIIALLAFSALQSFRRGLTREVIGLGAAILALALAMWFYGTAGSLIRLWVGSDRAADFLGFMMIVGAVLLLGALVGLAIRSFVRAVGLSFFDHMLGAVFGVIRGVVVAIALMTAYLAFGPQADPKTVPSAVVNSQLAPYLMEASAVLVGAAPAGLKQSFRESYSDAKIEIRKLARPGASE